MLEILKKAGLSATIATVVVLAITIGPIYYQYKTTVSQNEKIAALEEQVKQLKEAKAK